MALSDVMLATVGSLGYIGDVQVNGRARPAIGNDLYGSFGRDFATADGRRVDDHRADPAAMAGARPGDRAGRAARDDRSR